MVVLYDFISHLSPFSYLVTSLQKDFKSLKKLYHLPVKIPYGGAL